MKGKVAISIVIAALIAIVLIVGVYGIPSLRVGTPAAQSTTGTGADASGSSTGTLAVLITDPPTIPQGVTAVYINYSDIEVHVYGAGNHSGWAGLQSSGEINLLGVLNSTETIAAAKITDGTFNALRFNVTGAVVTFQGVNYTADLVYQEHTLYVPISGGITVSGGQTAGALIEMSPTVLLLGNTTNPTFAFLPAARAYILPANSVSIHPHVGDRNDYNGNIASQIHRVTHFQITSVSLTPGSFSITVDNTGAATVIFRLAALTSTTSVSGGWVPSTPFGSVSKISEFFVVAPNGTLAPLTGSSYNQVIQTLALAGFALAPHQTATFAYSGQISLGALIQQNQNLIQSINSGQRFVVTLFGSGEYEKTLVTASQGTGVAASTTTTRSSSSTTTSPGTTTTISTSSSSSSTSTTGSSSNTLTQTSSSSVAQSSTRTSTSTSFSSSTTSETSPSSTSTSTITSETTTTSTSSGTTPS